ncbi:hypothetical protein T492DRAFT_851215 [Pavlovales sp. CCMP2436]|nr:hypothetical protein T492DRAFT_851215 [Pavlovales sp. CCMP2436]
MEKASSSSLTKNETLASDNVIEEDATVTVGFTSSIPPVQEPPPAVLEPKAKRPVSEKQRMNYLAANKRRLQILAEAKEVRVAAALEAKRIKESSAEYELAVRLAKKYGFAAVPSQQTAEAPVEHKEAHAPTPAPPVPTVSPVQPVQPVPSAPPVLSMSTEKTIEKTIEKTSEKTIEEVAHDALTDRVLEEANEIWLTIPRFSRVRGRIDSVYLLVPATSIASMSDSPFAGHDKVYYDLSKDSLERLITKLEASSKKKQNSLNIIDDFMASLKDNALRQSLEKLICNRRHLRVSVWVITQTYRSMPLTIRKLISDLFLFRVSNLRELESVRYELVLRDKHEFHALYNHVFKPGGDSHQFMYIDVAEKMTAVNALNQDQLMDFIDTDPRNLVTNWLLNGQPYDGAMYPMFELRKNGRAVYMTGPRHHALSERLVYSSRPVIFIIERTPRVDLPRTERTPKTIFNAFKPTLFTDTLPDSLGDPVQNRTIIPERLRPFNDMRTPFMRPRGAVAGGLGRGGLADGPGVFYDRVPLQMGPPVMPNSSAEVPPGYAPQPPFVPTQVPESIPAPSDPRLALVPRQVRQDTRRFQPPPTVGPGTFRADPPLYQAPFQSTRFSDPALPPGFVRAPQTTQTSQTPRITMAPGSSTLPRISFNPPTPATGSSDLTLPFDMALFESPLSVVAELTLPFSIGTAANKSVGLQYSFSSSAPIAAGCICVLGDTLLLESEAVTDPNLSTYTLNQ